MPTGVYIRANDVQARLRAGLAADHVDDFSGWLRHRRYTDKTIVEGLPQVLGSPRHEGILASFFDLGKRVAWILRLVKTGAAGEGRTLDVMEINRPDDLGDIADLGLTLDETKRLLGRLQQAIVAA